MRSGWSPARRSRPSGSPCRCQPAAYEIPQPAQPGHEPYVPPESTPLEPPAEQLPEPVLDPEPAPLEPPPPEQAPEPVLDPAPAAFEHRRRSSCRSRARLPRPPPTSHRRRRCRSRCSKRRPSPSPSPSRSRRRSHAADTPAAAAGALQCGARAGPSCGKDAQAPCAALGTGADRRAGGAAGGDRGDRAAGALARRITPPTRGRCAAPKVVRVLIPEGKTRAQIAADRQCGAGLTGSYRVASRSSPLLDPRHYGAPAGTHTLEGFLFPATYDANPGASGARASSSEQLIAFQRKLRREDDRARARAARDALRAADGRLDGRARGAAAERPREDRGGHLQPPASRACRSGSTRRSTTRSSSARASRLHARTDRIAAAHRLAVQHAHAHAACRRRRSPTRALASIEAAAHPAHAAYLYYVAGADGCGEQVFSDHAGRIRSERRRLRGGASRRTAATRRAASRQVMPRSACSAGPSRTAARRRCTTPRSPRSGMDEWHYQRLPVPPGAVRRDDARAGRLGLRRRQRHDPAQAGRARARRRGQRGGARDRRREHADVRRRRHDRGREHRRARAARGARRARRGACSALVLGAGGSARAVVWALLRGGRARGVDLEPHRRARARRSRASSGRAPCARPTPPICSSTAPRWASGREPARAPIGSNHRPVRVVRSTNSR